MPLVVTGGAETEARQVCSLDDLDYELPDELIAQRPLLDRSDARLLVLDRPSGCVNDRRIADLPDLLRPGDLLVLNDSRVLPAKILARRATGGKVEGLFLHEERLGVWRVLIRGSHRHRVSESIVLDGPLEPSATLTLLERFDEGQWLVGVEPPCPAVELLERVGHTPLPPYIERRTDHVHSAETDRSRYQTVYARVPGSVAAPTAGLHFNERLLRDIQDRGVEVAFLTLHVGLGTFKPIVADTLSGHVMQSEQTEVSESLVRAVRACRARGGRVVAVGTTTVRALESAAQGVAGDECLSGYTGATNLFIRPPYRFRVADGLLTNFHLPRSTLLALVMAFAGVEQTQRAYGHAVEAKYRFYSYGDAMLIQ